MAVSIGGVQRYIPTGMSAPNISQGMVSFPDTSNIPIPTSGAQTLDYGVPGVQPFSFDFAAETRKAYEQLKPFYEHLLSFSGGRLDLAKRTLEYTYQQGMRESTQAHEQSTRELALQFPQENEALETGLNQRGMLQSGIGETQKGRLGESQGLRSLAVDRALADRESRLTSEKGFGTEAAYRDFEEGRFDLERQRRGEASQMAGNKYSVKSNVYQSQLQKAQQEEMRRVQNVQNTTTQNMYAQPAPMNTTSRPVTTPVRTTPSAPSAPRGAVVIPSTTTVKGVPIAQAQQAYSYASATPQQPSLIQKASNWWKSLF